MKHRHPLPATVSTLVERLAGSVLLESASAPDGLNGWTRLFCSPERMLVAYTPDELHLLLDELHQATTAGLQAAGFLTYEAGACFEPKAELPTPESGKPLAWFGLYRRAWCFDHATGTFPEGQPEELFALESLSADETVSVDCNLATSAAEYAGKIESVQEWIRSGDVYQLNYTVPLTVELNGQPGALYRELIRRQPVRYAAFVHWQPGRRILSLSPELFFRMEAQQGRLRLTAQPMKGTAARGRTTQEDLEHARWLQADEKNRAENLMIVDLLRNDLGRVARFGSVRVPELFAVERHPTLWQMTSTVEAELRPGQGAVDVLAALFPCGSITGAPKVRAMQLLAGLEQRPRGVYTGSIGYMAADRAEFNVAIRTLELDGQSGSMGVGSGVVIDSNPEDEFAECQLKTSFLTKASSEFELIESLRWQGQYPRLDLHLERLCDSAAYFGFPCDPVQIADALQQHAAGFLNSAPRKVRMLLDRRGELKITSELLAVTASEPVSVCLARRATHSADSFLFHKTTCRGLYEESFHAAAAQGFGEVLFCNEREELTEGAISNLYLVREGKWRTPALASGVLNGVERRYLLATRPEVEEGVLTLEDLRTADELWLSNAVRGLRPACINWAATRV